MQHWLGVVQQIRTPLMLAGLIVVVTYFLYRDLLKASGPLRAIVARYVFILAMVTMVLGGIEWLAHALMVTRWAPPTLFGRVHEKGVHTAGIDQAKVFMEPQEGTVRHATTSQDGDFIFSSDQLDVKQTARFWAQKDGYEPDNDGEVFPLQSLAANKEKVDLQLKKLARAQTATTTNPQSILQHLAAPPPQPQVVRDASTKVSSFYFIYQFDPPGRRDWSQFRDDVWLERYPNGSTTVFQVSGHVSVDGCPGTLAYNIQEKSFEVFIPDKGCRLMWLRFRNNSGQWNWLAQMQDVM